MTAGDLRSERGRHLVDSLTGQRVPFVEIVDLRHRSSPSGDVVVLDLDIELPQRPRHPVARRERVAVTFWEDDRTYPEVISLRADFPLVPHLNLRDVEIPRSFCLYEEPWAEVKLRWSPRAFVERIHEWLAKTAIDAVHAPGQAEEPFFLTVTGILLVDQRVENEASADNPAGTRIVRLDGGSGRQMYVTATSDAAQKMDPMFVVVGVQMPPQVSGVIRRSPQTLEELDDLFRPSGDFTEHLRTRLRGWVANKALLRMHPVLLLAIPMKDSTDEVVRTDLWAFASSATIESLGESLDVWRMNAGIAGLVLQSNVSNRGRDVRLDTLKVVRTLTRRTAALLNGEVWADPLRVLAVGAGALGSQVVMNLVRSGWGDWTIIDSDEMLPHNLVRHALPGPTAGWGKAVALAYYANSIFDDEPIATGSHSDLLQMGVDTQAAIGKASLCIDMSASVAVARCLANDYPDGGRRTSIFLNPDASDLVVLAEDEERSERLESLEMQYYRALIEMPELEGHTAPGGSSFRYGQGCRDTSAEIAQDFVALHAATASRAIRRLSATKSGQITIFRAGRDDGSVRPIQVPTHRTLRFREGGWEIWTDEVVLTKAARLRESRLPAETGGVLIGAVDSERSRIYVADLLASPPDSKEWPSSYVRGSQILTHRITQIEVATAFQLGYVGEWHSHPDGASASLSRVDRKGLQTLADIRSIDGFPSLALIVSKSEASWYLEMKRADAS